MRRTASISSARSPMLEMTPMVAFIEGKAKARGQGRGKAKAKNKTKTRSSRSAALVDEVKAKAEGKSSIKAQVMLELAGGRDVAEVIAETWAEIMVCEDSIAEADGLERGLELEVQQARRDMETADHTVEEAVRRENAMFKRLRATCLARAEAAQEAAAALGSREDAAKTHMILELELQSRQKVAESEQARKAAQEAAEAAKKNLDELREKLRVTAEAIRLASLEQRSKQLQLLQAHAETKSKEAGKERRAQDREAAAASFEIDRMRTEREKERQRMFKEVTRGRRSQGGRASVAQRMQVALAEDPREECHIPSISKIFAETLD